MHCEEDKQQQNLYNTGKVKIELDEYKTLALLLPLKENKIYEEIIFKTLPKNELKSFVSIIFEKDRERHVSLNVNYYINLINKHQNIENISSNLKDLKKLATILDLNSFIKIIDIDNMEKLDLFSLFKTTIENNSIPEEISIFLLESNEFNPEEESEIALCLAAQNIQIRKNLLNKMIFSDIFKNAAQKRRVFLILMRQNDNRKYHNMIREIFNIEEVREMILDYDQGVYEKYLTLHTQETISNF